MPHPELFVALGPQRFRVERPWGALPVTPGMVSDVCCDASGRVLVLLRHDRMVDAESPAVVVLAPDGRLEAAWGQDIMDGHMMTIHPDGRLFVVDRDAHEVTIFSPAGRRLGALGQRHQPGQPFNAPCDVAFSPEGEIFVADGYGNAQVHHFSAAGLHQGSWGRAGRRAGEFCTPHSVWVLADGRVAVADRDNSRIQIFSAAGEHRADIQDVHKPMDVHGGPDGSLYVTDQVPRLSLFAPNGVLLGRCRPVLNGAHGMWRAADGCLYLAEMHPSRLTRLVPV